jgi:hypothetical protein
MMGTSLRWCWSPACTRCKSRSPCRYDSHEPRSHRSEPEEDAGNGQHCLEVGRSLLVARGDAAVLFEPGDEPLQDIALVLRYSAEGGV